MDLQIEGVVDVDELQSGRSSIIYRAHHRDLGREIAIKVFRSLDQDFLTRFETEIKELISLSADRRIATIYGSGLTGSGQAYLILELCESSFADSVAEDGPMAPLRACDVLIDVARAISTAHAEGVVHGNLRPEKILVDANQELNVADFGLWFGSLSVGTDATDAYVAPETNSSGTMAPPVDIYSFGALLGHTIDGNLPPSDTDGSQNKPIPDLVLDGVPDGIREVIEACLSADPTERPSAEEVVVRMEGAVDSERLFDGEAVFDLSWLDENETADDEQAAEPEPEELEEDPELDADFPLLEDSSEDQSVDEPRLAEDEEDPFFGRGRSTAPEHETELPPLVDSNPTDYFAKSEAEEPATEEPAPEEAQEQSELDLDEASFPDPELEIVIKAANPPADVEVPREEPITVAALDIAEEAPAARTNGTHTNGSRTQGRAATGLWSTRASKPEQMPSAQAPAQGDDANLFGARSELRTVGAPAPSSTNPNSLSTSSSSRVIILAIIAVLALVILVVAFLVIGNRSGSQESVSQLSIEGSIGR